MGRTKELLADRREQERDLTDADSSYEIWLSKVAQHQKSLTRTTQALDDMFEGFAMAIKYGQEESKKYN